MITHTDKMFSLWRAAFSSHLLYALKVQNKLFLKKQSWLYFHDNTWSFWGSSSVARLQLISFMVHFTLWCYRWPVFRRYKMKSSKLLLRFMSITSPLCRFDKVLSSFPARITLGTNKLSYCLRWRKDYIQLCKVETNISGVLSCSRRVAPCRSSLSIANRSFLEQILQIWLHVRANNCSYLITVWRSSKMNLNFLSHSTVAIENPKL